MVQSSVPVFVLKKTDWPWPGQKITDSAFTKSLQDVGVERLVSGEVELS